VFSDWKSNVQRVIKSAKNTTFLQSLTRDISQTNEPILKILCRIGDQVILCVFAAHIWHRQIKNVTLGGNFKIPTHISPKPRIGGAKNFTG
jgi:hypothetical protein